MTENDERQKNPRRSTRWPLVLRGDLMVKLALQNGCEPKNRGKNPKMDGENNGNPY